MYSSNSSFQGCVFPLSHEYQVTWQHFLKPEQLEQWPNKLHYWTTQGLWASNVVSCYPVKVQRSTTLHTLGQKVDNKLKSFLQWYLQCMTLFLLQNIKKDILKYVGNQRVSIPILLYGQKLQLKVKVRQNCSVTKILHSIFFNAWQKKENHSFGTTWGWVNDDSIFIFGWTMPLQFLSSCLHTFSKRYPSFFSKLYTQIQELHTQNAKCLITCKMKHCIQNITNTSQKQTFANTFAIILIPVSFVCVCVCVCVT